jgi:hypothetical protein
MPGVSLLRHRDDKRDAARAKTANKENEAPIGQKGGNKKAKLEITAHKIRLYLPSQVDADIEYNKELRHYEWDLRIAELEDILEAIRGALRLLAHIDQRRVQGGDGVAAATRSQKAISSCHDRVRKCHRRYNDSRAALASLAKNGGVADGWEKRYKVLNADDVQKLPKGGEIGEGRVKLSWIWYDMGSDPDDPKAIHEGKLIG